VALGQALAIATFAVRPWLTGDSLTALAMVAASAVVIAALQNIVSARVRWVVPIALAFGVLNGFAFAQSFAASAPLAGSHQWVALTVFLLVVDLGQFWLGAVVWATRLWLAGHGTPERVVSVLASVIIAHAALHRIVDRGHLLAQSGSFGAERAIVYLRPDVVVVRDSLAANAPHTWEWNIHAVNRMTQVTPTSVVLRNGPAQMCVEMVSGPEVRFSQTDQFTARPSTGANQWHGTFATSTPSREAEFIAVMRVGSDCTRIRGAPASAKRSGDTMEVSVEGKTIRFAGDAVTVK